MPELFDITILGEDESSEVHRLLACCPDVEPRKYRDGDFLVREGEEDQDLFIVLRGAFTVEHPPTEPGGRPAIIASTLCDAASVAIVGEMSYFGTQRRTASVRSSGSTYALKLQPRHIDEIISGFPRLTQVICQQFTRRLKEANEALRRYQGLFLLEADKRMGSAGEVLFRAGEPAPVLHQLLVGSVSLEGDGESRVLEPEALPSGFLEPEAFLGGRPHRCSAVLASDAFVATVPASQKETLLRCHPGLALRLLQA